MRQQLEGLEHEAQFFLAQGGPAILAALRADISSGTLAPGAVLRQAELAEPFGTSRIPVGKKMPSSTPIGNSASTATTIFTGIGSVM